MATATAPRLKARYNAEVKKALKDELGLSNVMQVPTLDKIVINMGVGKATQQPSLLEGAVADLTLISGQKPVVTKSRDSIASFKLRENQAIGCKVTLRGDRMWEFFDRLLSVAIPRIRDFRGLPAHSWDGRGNYTFGLSEQTVFPEIDYDKIDAPRGMDITIVTTAVTDEQGRALLDAFGFPFKRGNEGGAPTRQKAKSRGPVRGGKKKVPSKVNWDLLERRIASSDKAVARRLRVPGPYIGEVRHCLRDKIGEHAIEFEAGPGLHLGTRDTRESV